MKKHQQQQHRHHHHRRAMFYYTSSSSPQASCKLLLWVLLMISACLVCSTNSQPAQRDDADDWQNACTNTCKCRWADSRKAAECRPVDRIPDTVSSEVQSLDLSDNGIVNIEDDAFKKVVHVQMLDLHKNLIRHIERLAFNGLKIVTVLDLTDNHLEHIDPSVFEPMTNLRELRLRGNPLQRFTGSSQFPALWSLESIDFSYCHLSRLPSELFTNLRKLYRLDLSGNSFQQLSVDVLRPLHHLNSLILASNPFICDCHLRDLHNFVMDRLVALKTTCASNSSSSSPNGGKQFQDLTTKDFYCPPEIVFYQTHGQNLPPEDSHIRSVETGKDLTFDCQIEGDPMPELVWLRDNTLLFNTSGPDVNNEKYIVSTVETTMNKVSNLTIKSLTKEDSAIYTCQAAAVSIGTVRRGTELNVDSSVLVGGVSGGKSNKTWLWILLGILGFFVLVALLVLIVLCFLRQRRRGRKAQRVSDINGDESTTTTKKLYENRSGIGTMSSATTPLIEKSNHQGTIESNHRTPSTTAAASPLPPPKQDISTLRRDFMDGGGHSGGHHGPPMTPLLSHYPHASVPSTPTFLPHTHHQHPNIFAPQPLPYHPGGWATYDPRRGHQHDAASLSYRQPMIYGRLHSPFSGSVASFTSEPPRQGPVFAGPGYVTLPRRHRIPSWTQGTGTGAGGTGKTPVPPSPTGSLPLVPNLRTRYYGHIGPRYDTIGPRTTVDGGSNLSLNKIGRDGARTPMTPSTPASTSTKIPLNRSLTPLTPSTGRIPKTHNSLGHHHHQNPYQNQMNQGTLFNFDPIEENDGPSTPTKTEPPWPFPIPSQDHRSHIHNTNNDNNAGPTSLEVPPPIPPLPEQLQQQQPEQQQQKQPPLPPAKPKRKSTNLDDEPSIEPAAAEAATFNNIQGTEV